MAKRGEIYKCDICGNIVEAIHEGGGDLVCCGQPMTLMQEKSEEEGLTEKHVPVIEKSAKGILVKIGSVTHPMEEAHYIEWIRVEAKDGRVCRHYLKPNDKPEAEFPIQLEEAAAVHEYCNLHRLWVRPV